MDRLGANIKKTWKRLLITKETLKSIESKPLRSITIYSFNFRLKRLIEQGIKKIISPNIAIVKPFRFMKLPSKILFSTQRNWNLLPLLSHTLTAHNNQPSPHRIQGIPNPPAQKARKNFSLSVQQNGAEYKKEEKRKKLIKILNGIFCSPSNPLHSLSDDGKIEEEKNSNTKSHLCWTLRALFFLSTTTLLAWVSTTPYWLLHKTYGLL